MSQRWALRDPQRSPTHCTGGETEAQGGAVSLGQSQGPARAPSTAGSCLRAMADAVCRNRGLPRILRWVQLGSACQELCLASWTSLSLLASWAERPGDSLAAEPRLLPQWVGPSGRSPGVCSQCPPPCCCSHWPRTATPCPHSETWGRASGRPEQNTTISKAHEPHVHIISLKSHNCPHFTDSDTEAWKAEPKVSELLGL